MYDTEPVLENIVPRNDPSLSHATPAFKVVG
jgi:hypothetical protein